nr:AI-2E family transporter [uncultured Acetatifactor sp.]
MNQDRNYWKLGITIFVSLSATVCFFFLIFRFGEIRAALGIIRSALQPLFVGIALAYVLCPVEKRLERLLGRAKGLGRFARPISVLLTMIAALAILVLFCALVVPQLVDSISGLVRDLPKLLETQLEKLNRYLKSDNDAAAAVMQMIESSENSLLAWIRTNLLATVSTVATSILSMGSALINTVVSVVVTIYLLLGREHYLAQCRKLFLSVSRNERFNRAVFEALTQTNRIFNGFISGKLLDSLIVGIICFVCLSLLRMPYALLISVIVGMTNIIPMFGPFIGAVPSAFLLLLVSPMKCLIFLVFIIILQQVDGNIIGPRILGNSTGLSALYVTVAMLLFGKLMGFFGMIVGVPLFATLYYIVKRLAEYSLRKQGLPADTKEYVHRKNTELVQEGAAGEGRKE